MGETLRNEHPGSSYSFLNLKVGDIDTTNPDVPPTPAPSPPSPAPSPPLPPSPSPDCPGGSFSSCVAACSVVTGDAHDVCISVCKQDCPATATTTAAPAPAPSPVPSGCPGGTLSACIGGCPTNPAIFAACVAHCEEECTPTTTPAPAGMCCWQDCKTMSTCLPSDACSNDEVSCHSCSGIWCPGSALFLV